MNDLEDKIYKYLKAGTFADLKIVAHDIAEICNTYITNNPNPYFIDTIDNLVKENAALKSKLSANRFIYNTKERHKYQDKIAELEAKIDCYSKDGEIIV